MLRPRLLLLLLCVALALGAALLRPLPGRADAGDETPPPTPPDPANAEMVVPPLPVFHTTPPVRRTASVAHRAVRAAAAREQRVVTFAKRLIGVRYSWGGTSPRSGFDCSGFVRYVYSHFGVSLAHSSYSQFRNGVRVARQSLKPGDLVFFDGLGHVGIYVGNGRFIHAPHSGTRVQISPLGGWYSSRYDGARRLIRHA